MSADNRNMDSALAPGYSDCCTGTTISNNPGAGVNAGKVVVLKFAGSDSLSELVWSPQKGLSLKCAEGSSTDKKSFLLWNVGPSNVPSSTSECIRCKGTDDDDKIVEGNLTISPPALHSESRVDERAIFIVSPRSSAKAIVGSCHGGNLESKYEMEQGKLEGGVYDPSNEQTDYMPERNKTNAGQLIPDLLLGGSPDTNCEMPKTEVFAAVTEVHPGIMSEAQISTLQVSPCPDIPNKQVKGCVEEERNDKLRKHGSTISSVEKLEYTAENDMWHKTTKDAQQQSGERHLSGCSDPLEANTENNRSQLYLMNGKDKALSEGDCSRRFSVSDDDCQESVESCNSACLLGKRRWNFTQHLTVESKRSKEDIDGNLASTSMVRHDSSFMNWISNMVKGFSKSNHEDGLSLDLTVAHSSQEHTNVIQETAICSRQQDSLSRKKGFQTIFQSLYSPNTKPLEAGTLNNSSSAEGPSDLLRIDKNGAHISPNSYSGQNGASCDHIFISNEKILPFTAECIVGQSSLTCAGLAENKDSSNQEHGRGKDGTTSSDSLADRKIKITEDESPHLMSDSVEACKLSNKGNLSSSLWITRFSTEACSTSLNLDNASKDNGHVIQSHVDCSMPNPRAQTSPGFNIDEKYLDNKVKSNENSGDLGKELPTSAANAGVSFGLKDTQEHSSQNVLQNLNSVLPSHVLKTSEAMASTFAGRLEALRHIIPSVIENDASSNAPTCFFCGKIGHNVHTCSQITETELRDLLRSKQKSCFVARQDNLRISACNGEKPSTITSAGKEFSGKRSSSSNDSQNPISTNFGKKKTSENRNLPACNLVSVGVAEVPKAMFEAVRRLQLSRADILKWSNYHASLSHLEGLFLRLRLGKWEEGLGGTGYYVACITEVEQARESAKDCKKSISVNVGGMKCLVGSQYISNHDFLEDELMVWWRRILKSGGKLPSKEDLESKYKQRIALGF